MTSLSRAAFSTLMALALLAGCDDAGTAPQDGGSGGSDAGGGGGGSDAGGTSSVGGGSGGSTTCPIDESTVEEHCGEGGANCTQPEELECVQWIYSITIYQGCGLTQLSMVGDVGDSSTRIYDASMNLVYWYSNSGYNGGECAHVVAVGERPSCNEWVNICDELSGLGGQGGMGGGTLN